MNERDTAMAKTVDDLTERVNALEQEHTITEPPADG